jgi:hypothetical protein
MYVQQRNEGFTGRRLSTPRDKVSYVSSLIDLGSANDTKKFIAFRQYRKPHLHLLRRLSPFGRLAKTSASLATPWLNR